MSDVAKLIVKLRSADSDARMEAVEALSSLGAGAAPAALALCDAVADDALAENAASALEGLAAPAASDALALCQLLDSDNPATAYWAATLLGRLGAGCASTATLSLAAALGTHKALEVRERAAWALAQIGPTAEGALTVLKALRGEPGRLGRLVEQAIAAIEVH